MRKSIVILLCILLAGLIFSLFEVRLVKTVSYDIYVPDDYLTIQEAINSASDWDTIFVRQGTYFENIVVNRTVSLIGEYRNTVIIGDNTSAIITIVANNASVSDFELVLPSMPAVAPGIVINASIGSTVADNNIDGEQIGIVVEGGVQCNIDNNHLYNGYDVGMNVEGGYENLITNNIIEGNFVYGIVVTGSNRNLIEGNTANTAFDSLQLIDSHYNWVLKNSFGFVWSQVSECIELLRSNNNTIERNTFRDNGFDYVPRLEFSQSHNNIIFFNEFKGHNSEIEFIGNCTNNAWDYGFTGNLWSGYDGVDSDGDGIGDTPYVIDEENQDNYPLTYWDPSDVNQDFRVDIFDFVMVGALYGSTRLDPWWDYLCDIAKPFGKIDIFDIVMMANNYGYVYYPLP